MIYKILDYIRRITPLSARRRFGPVFAYIDYLFRIYIETKNTPNILSLESTLDEIIEKKVSVVRFGDGEISLIDKINLGFQKSSDELASKLSFILHQNDKNLLVCIPGIWGKIDNLTSKSFWFSIHHLFKHGQTWNKFLNKDQIYGDAFITRPYLSYKNKTDSGKIFEKAKKIWEGRDVLLIEGEKTRMGVGNDLFENTKSLKRILCPSENAYNCYDKIKESALTTSKDSLILVSLGPTAKVLVYDLFALGYQAIDIGHLDMEYEMFLRKQNNIIEVKYKYFNEIGARNPEECLDKKYLDQILTKID